MSTTAIATDWEQEIASLLQELSATQDELLEVLGRKHELLAKGDADGLSSLADTERQLLERLESCHQQRGELLSRAGEEGLPSDSIRSLASAVTVSDPQRLKRQFTDASVRVSLLQHRGLSAWVIAQRTLIHLSQLLEIIATGGRQKPTYGNDAATGGSLLDQAV